MCAWTELQDKKLVRPRRGPARPGTAGAGDVRRAPGTRNPESARARGGTRGGGSAAREGDSLPEEDADWEDSFVAPISALVPRAFAGLRLDQAIAQLFPQYSRSRLQSWLGSGHIRVDGVSLAETSPLALTPPAQHTAGDRRPWTNSTVVCGGELIDVAPPVAPEGSAPRAQRLPITVVYEDEDLIVINKAAGIVVHPGAGVPDGTLMNALLAHDPKLQLVPRAGIVHRLDKDTSGLLVVARNVSAQAALVRQLADRSMRRTYLAVVQGDPAASGRVDAPIGRDPLARTRMAVTRRGKDARTAFRVLERYGRAALVECRLETGRTHQIRVHMQHIRHPLVGDPVYRRGTRHSLNFSRQALHAAELSLAHPRTGEQMTWTAALPADMKRLVQSLRRDS